MQQLLIPDKIRVGFQERNDTYTKKLGYVIYYDKKGVLRKEKSWESWRNKNIDPVEYDNEPTEGFVLNRNGGGGRGWDSRNEFVRIYDPRDFEFEIDFANLLYILSHCDCSRGKGLEGKFVYSWDGTKLILLPCNTEDYKSSANFTELQTTKVPAKELVAGHSYRMKDQSVFTYLGKFDYHKFFDSEYEWRQQKPPKNGKPLRMFVFWDGKTYQCYKGVKDVSRLESDVIHPDFADLVESYNKNYKHGSPVVELYLQEEPLPADDSDNYYRIEWFEKHGDKFRCYYKYRHHTDWGAYAGGSYYLINGNVTHSSDRSDRELNKKTPDKPTSLYARLENGTSFKVKGY